MGAMKMEYAPMKLRNVLPSLIIIHGQSAHPPSSMHTTMPRLMFIHLGNIVVRSKGEIIKNHFLILAPDIRSNVPLANDTELAEILLQI